MPGAIMLVGGSEFQKGLERADQEAIELSNKSGDPLAETLVLAVASGARKAHEMSGDGSVWLSQQGALRCEGIAVIDRTAAQNQELARRVGKARLLYLVGGDPAYFSVVLNGTPLLDAIRQAHKKGATLAGSGSGAMLLAEHLYLEESDEIVSGLGFVPNTCLIPYFGSKGRKWSKRLAVLLPETYLLGIDEKTAMIGGGNQWQVAGRGWVTLLKNSKARKFVTGQPFALDPKK